MMDTRLTLSPVLLSLFFILSGFGQAWTHHVCPSTSSTDECWSLDDYVLNKSSLQWNDTEFVFEIGRHSLHHQLALDDLSNLALTGVQGDGAVVIHCPVYANFIFHNVANLSLVNLTIESCGQNHTKYPAPLVFWGGHNIHIHRIAVESSPGALFFENVVGEIVVSSCTFINNGDPHLSSNSAFHSIFKDCSSAETNLLVSDSYFINNTILNEMPNKCKKKQRAGGAFFYTTCPSISATFENVVFHNNRGCFGGGLTMTLGSTKQRLKKQVHIQNSTFSDNYARYGAAAIIDIYYNCKQEKPMGNLSFSLPLLVSIHSTNFTGNTGKYNGGALYIRHKESSELCTAGNVVIEECHFIGNSLHTFGGVAIFNINYMAYSVTPHIVPQFYVIVNRSLMEDNYLQHNSYGNSGSGVILTESNPHFQLIDTTIINNKCTGVVAKGSNIVFEGEVEISYNNASSGGGVVLCSGAIMYFGANTHLWRTPVDKPSLFASFNTCITPGKTQLLWCI